MDKDLKTILKDEIDRRNSSIPLVAKELDIPRDRIYAWYRDGSSPKAKDAAKIEKWLKGEKSGETSTIGLEPTPMQILDRLSRAFIDQAEGFKAQAKALSDQAEGFKVQAEAFKAQGELMATIRQEMARETTQADMKISLADVHSKVTTIWERQHLAIEEIREQFESVRKEGRALSKGVRKKAGHNDDND